MFINNIKHWHLCFIEFEALLGGLVMGWNARIDAFFNHFVYASILLQGKAKEIGKTFNVVNLYGPSIDR